MTFMDSNASRREAIARFGALAVGAGLSAPLATAAPALASGRGLRIARVGIAVASRACVNDAARAWLGASCKLTEAGVPSPSTCAASAGLRNIDVEFHAPAFDDCAASEAFHASSLSGHLVELEVDDPDRLAARANAIGVRLFRDHTIRGHRLIQLDPEHLGVRFQIASRKSPAPLRADAHTASVKGLVVASRNPEQSAAIVGAIFDVRVSRNVVQLENCPVQYVAAQTGAHATGLVSLHLATT